MMQKVGLYIRVSTQEQANDGYSIREQEDRLRKYSEAHGWVVYKVYSDPGYSGAKLERPALNELISDVKSNKINKVIVYKLDRLSRRQKDTLYLIEDIFLPSGADFISMTENFDTGSPLGRAMIGILSVFAQLEREQIKERMQLGLEARARDGYFHGGGFEPIGYDYMDGELVINDYEKMQIRLIYDLYTGGMGCKVISDFLNKKGYRNKQGSWHESAVRSCLFTPLYKGVIVWNGQEYEGRHEAILTEEEFNNIQSVRMKRLADNPHLSLKPFRHTSLLGGLIFCGNCGARYCVKQNAVKRYKTTDPNKKPLKYYTCYSRGKTNKRMIKDPNCKNPSIQVAKLDKIIIDEIRKLAVDEEYLNSLISDNTTENINDNSEMLKSRITTIDSQISKLIDLYQVGNIDFNMINKRIDDLNAEKKKLESEIDSAKDAGPELNISEAKKIISTIPDVIDSEDTEAIKNVVHSLINSIIIYDDAIEINWKFN